MSTEIALELALRLRAEMEQGLAALRQLEGGVEGVEEKSGRANTELGKMGGAAGEIEKVAAASERASRGLSSAGETAEEAEERIRRMVQASLEYRRAQDAQIAAEQAAAQASQENSRVTAEQAAEIERVTRAAYESQAAITAQIQSMGEFAARVERGARSLEDLADIEREMDRLMAAGLLTESEQLEMLESLEEQERKLLAVRDREQRQLEQLIKAYDPVSVGLQRLEHDEQKLKEAVDAGRISREQYNRAVSGLAAQRNLLTGVQKQTGAMKDRVKVLGDLNLNQVRVQQSAAAVMRSLAQGHWNQVQVSVTSLAARTGFLGQVFTGAGMAITGAVAALGALALAAWRGYQQSQALERALIVTGNAAGVTGGQVQLMAGDIDDATGKIGKGQQALLALVQAGDVAADVLASAGRAAVNLSELTGQSIDQTTADVRRLMQEPAKYAEELNRRYNFLTAEIYNQVRAHERLGETQEAQRLVMDALARDTDEKLRKVREELSWLELAWEGLGNVAKWAWDEMMGLGRKTPTEQLLEEARRALAELDAGGSGRMATEYGLSLGSSAAREKLLAEIARLEDKVAGERAEAEAKAAGKAAERAAIEAEARQSAAVAQDRAIAKAKELKQLEEDMAALRARNITEVEGMSLADLAAKRRAQIEERYKERKTPKSEADKEFEQQQRFVEQLERQAAVFGLNAQQVREYELAERNLTGALLKRAKAAAELLRQAEEQRSIDEDAQSLAQAQISYLRAIGQHQAAAERELEQRYSELLERLERRGDEAGTTIIQNLFSAEKARAALQQLQAESDRVLSGIARAEQRVGIARDAGLISNIEAQRRLLELREREIQHLQQQIPLLREQAAILKDPALLAALDDMELRLFELQNQADLFTVTLRNGLETGIANGLRSLADGTASVGDAVRGLVSDLAGAFADLAAQQLAAWATYQLMSAIRGGDGPDVAQPDPTQAAAAGTAYATPIAGAAFALGGAATAMGNATTALGFVIGPLGLSAQQIEKAAGELASAAALLLAANSMSMASGGFASGGWTGPGSKYSFAGYVHADEWVHPKEAVGYYGHGIMRAMQQRAIPREVFAGVSAPTVASPPRISFAEGGLARGEIPAPQVSVGVLNTLRARDLVEVLAQSREFSNLVINTMVENKRTFEAS